MGNAFGKKKQSTPAAATSGASPAAAPAPAPAAQAVAEPKDTKPSVVANTEPAVATTPPPAPAAATTVTPTQPVESTLPPASAVAATTVESAPALAANATTVAPPQPVVNEQYFQYGGAYLGDPKDTEDFKYITFTELPRFTPAHKSAMAKYLTAELFALLKDRRTSRGYTLSNAIMTGVVTPHLGVGATAGDEESWEVFKELYYPIIKDWHGYDANSQKHPVDLDASKLRFTEEQQQVFNEYVVSTRIRAARNISGYALPCGATVADRAAVEAVLKQTFAGLSGELAGTYYELGALTPEQTAFLLEHGFLFQIPSPRNLLTGAGAARSWPDNRGIFHNDTRTALAWVNEEDHCRIISMEGGGNISSVFTRFCALSHAIQASAEANGTRLMWNDVLGFLGTCPSNLGTGLRASVMIKLPEFNKLMEQGIEEDKHLLDDVCSTYDLQPRGSAGEHSAAVGGKFDVSNKQRLGFSEVQLVQKMIDGVSKVIECEKMLAAGSSPADVRAFIAVSTISALEASEGSGEV